MTRIILVALAALFALTAVAQPADPSYPLLEKAYEALRQSDYERAVSAFEQAVKLAPDRPSIRKDLAYTLIKIGENTRARDQFAEAMRLDPADEHVALEYAFLCYETKQEVTARRVFFKYKAVNSTAAEAFENIDRPLRDGIARWQQALAASPENFSGHEELARLAEQRDDIALAAIHYERAWRLRPTRRDLLLDLGRAWRQQERAEDAFSALLAVSRGAEPRIAEQARELLGSRYPYVYEFEKALELDPPNTGLRRELAFLQLQLQQNIQAEKQFATVLERDPDDLFVVAQLGLLKLARGDTRGAMPLLNRVLASDNEELADRVRKALEKPQTLRGRVEEPRQNISNEARELAAKSIEKGYLQDAIKYLNTAVENDPVDFASMLKLGWTYNQLQNDRDAVRWFKMASASPDSKTSKEATRAYRNLAPQFERLRTTVWAFPMFSTRWHDLFFYSQVKTEWRTSNGWFRPYVSLRFIGDTRGVTQAAPSLAPQFYSEQSAIPALGIATKTWHGASGWLEAGEAVRFRQSPGDPTRGKPDYRGGITYAKSFGESSLLAETNDDLVYVHRFNRDTLFYSQNRLGYKGSRAQVFWNFGVTTDFKREHWANYAEIGPGVRFRVGSLPFLFSVNALRGVHLDGTGAFHDLRIGLWYAFTR
ncbi:MAG: tetratricopeptide repeat protein [Bryobacteraceae bacterium]